MAVTRKAANEVASEKLDRFGFKFFVGQKVIFATTTSGILGFGEIVRIGDRMSIWSYIHKRKFALYRTENVLGVSDRIYDELKLAFDLPNLL